MPEITKTEEQSPKPKNRIIWLIFAIIIFIVYFFALGSIPLLGPDEPRYAQVAREMYERNDWITPTLGGYNWFEKPSLLYWLEIVSYKLFGVSEFSARAGSAIFGLLTIASLWFLGKFIDSKLNESSQPTIIHNLQLKNWLFLISASSIGLMAFSRGASFDIILTFPITASLVAFFIFDQSNPKSAITRYLPLIIFYFFIGVSLLAKGLIGIVFPLGIVFFYFVLVRRSPGKNFVFSLFWGMSLSLLVAAVWYVPVYLKNGWTFVDEFFIQHHFARYTSNKYQHPQPFWFFWLVLPLMTLPWLPFFLASLWSFIKSFFQGNGGENTQAENEELITHRSPLTTLAFAWMLVPLVFFSFSGSKLPGYILPALPAALILTADYVSRFARNNRNREISLQVLALMMFTFVLIALQFFVPNFVRNDSVKYLLETANAQGYADAKILNLHTVSHNAEFYGAGRLIRLPDGKIRQFYGITEVLEEIDRENGKPVLVLVPAEYAYQLNETNLFSTKLLDSNDEFALFVIAGKNNEAIKAAM